MAVDRIRVMISSRNRDYVAVDGLSFLLANLRRALQAEINQTSPVWSIFIRVLDQRGRAGQGRHPRIGSCRSSSWSLRSS
jgi:hypothetical protein